MNNSGDFHVEMVPTLHIKRMPGMQIGTTREAVGKVRDFTKKRGCCNPVVLSDSGGHMTLLTGAASFEVCLEGKDTKIPAVVVKTDGEADDLIFALQAAQINESLSAVAAGSAIVELIDSHRVPRRHIAELLGKARSWISRMENIGRNLNVSVRRLVVEGRVSARSAQEIARLPDGVQMAFAVAACNDFLNKENIAYLVNRYLSKDTGAEERDRIVRTPRLEIPAGTMRRGRRGRDDSANARMSRAIAKCLDGVSHLGSLLEGPDIEESAVFDADIAALTDSLSVLLARLARLRAVLPRGKMRVDAGTVAGADGRACGVDGRWTDGEDGGGACGEDGCEADGRACGVDGCEDGRDAGCGTCSEDGRTTDGGAGGGAGDGVCGEDSRGAGSGIGCEACGNTRDRVGGGAID